MPGLLDIPVSLVSLSLSTDYVPLRSVDLNFVPSGLKFHCTYRDTIEIARINKNIKVLGLPASALNLQMT